MNAPCPPATPRDLASEIEAETRDALELKKRVAAREAEIAVFRAQLPLFRDVPAILAVFLVVGLGVSVYTFLLRPQPQAPREEMGCDFGPCERH